MYNGLRNTLIFTLGAAVGSVVTWKILKTKYEQIVQEEIDSVKAKLSKRCVEEVEECEKDAPQPETTRETYEKLADIYSTEKGGSDSMKNKSHIKILSPDDFAEDEDYETETLIYWSDGKLSDDLGNIVEDIDDMIGADFLDHFGEYEDYSIYVRNEKYKCEYEVIQDLQSYDEVFGHKEPDLTDEE